MKTLNQEINFETFNEFLLSDAEMINVRGGDGNGDYKGQVTPPVTTDPEI